MRSHSTRSGPSQRSGSTHKPEPARDSPRLAAHRQIADVMTRPAHRTPSSSAAHAVSPGCGCPTRDRRLRRCGSRRGHTLIPPAPALTSSAGAGPAAPSSGIFTASSDGTATSTRTRSSPFAPRLTASPAPAPSCARSLSPALTSSGSTSSRGGFLHGRGTRARREGILYERVVPGDWRDPLTGRAHDHPHLHRLRSGHQDAAQALLNPLGTHDGQSSAEPDPIVGQPRDRGMT